MNKKFKEELNELFTYVKDVKQAALLLEDVLTPAEYDSIAERWQIIKLLHAGGTHREVAKKLGISVSKVSRGARCLQYGAGGFKLFLK